MPETPNQFDDPNLKASVRRALGNGAPGASPELRRRIVDLIERETGGGVPLRLTPRPFRTRWMRWAVAALIALAATVAGGYLWHRHHEAEEREEYLAANLPLFNDMIRAADAPPAANSELAPTADHDALRKLLESKLGRRVPVPDWRPRGWTLASATLSPVGKHSAALLCYHNAGRKVVLVSLPATAYKAEEGEEPEPYEYTVDGHPLAGFVKDGCLNCVVGDRSLTPSELAGLKVE